MFRGTGETEIVLQERVSDQKVVLLSKQSPYPESSSKYFDINMTWWLKQFDLNSLNTRFAIDRNDKDCHTPVQNNDTKSALGFFREFYKWSSELQYYFVNHVYNIDEDISTGHAPSNTLSAIDPSGVFIPISPLLKNISDTGSTEGVVLDASVVNSFLEEHKKSLQEKCEEVLKLFPPHAKKSILNSPDVINNLALHHLKTLIEHYVESILFIEVMLRKQLISAIGKEITPSDFAEYMTFHNRKLFKIQFQPKPFCASVRRSLNHSPEGSVSLLQLQPNHSHFFKRNSSDSLANPIFTISKSSDDTTSLMQFALNSSTNVSFSGPRYLHGWMSHSFSDSSSATLQLVAQARQFSSFIVLIGRIASATVFDPKYAIIVQNKDEITIPLSLRQIPTPKEFKDAIQSLSPEQQKLAKAFRSMQLESTLFGICVIQIKPHLEEVLKLPPDSLTKEIKLNQDLMKLFIEYQIPSDLLSFDGEEDNSVRTKLDKVLSNVNAIKEIIKDSKAEEIEEQERVRDLEGKKMRKKELQSMPRSSNVYGSSRRLEECNEDSEDFAEDLVTTVNELKEGIPMMKSRNMVHGMAVLPRGGGTDSMVRRRGASPPPNPPPSAAAIAPMMISAELGNQKAVPPTLSKAQILPKTDDEIHSSVDLLPESNSVSGSVGVDYTKYPALLDSLYTTFDIDNALRPTIIDISSDWKKKSQPSLLLPSKSFFMDNDKLLTEKNNAFDLLDALSKSGH